MAKKSKITVEELEKINITDIPPGASTYKFNLLSSWIDYRRMCDEVCPTEITGKHAHLINTSGNQFHFPQRNVIQ